MEQKVYKLYTIWCDIKRWFKNPLYIIFKLKIIECTKVSLAKDEFLIFRVRDEIPNSVLAGARRALNDMFGAGRVLMISGDDVKLVKVKIEERMADEILLSEALKKDIV